MTKESPRPWTLEPWINVQDNDEFVGRILDANGSPVYAGPFSFAGLRHKDDAPLIVAAVNQAPLVGELVRALDKLPEELAGAATQLSLLRKHGDRVDWAALERLQQHHIEMQGLVAHANLRVRKAQEQGA